VVEDAFERTVMNFKCNITERDITMGSWEPDEFEVAMLPLELTRQGYRRISNSYCMIARIDRDDWLDVLAAERRCSRADFYNIDGSGVGDQHKDYYIRSHSKDILTVSPELIRKIPAYR
jgi:hypothetical protein